jgi:hypothetical protein
MCRMCLGYCLIRVTLGVELKLNFSATTNWFKFRKPFQIFDKFFSSQHSACTQNKFCHSEYDGARCSETVEEIPIPTWYKDQNIVVLLITAMRL